MYLHFPHDTRESNLLFCGHGIVQYKHSHGALVVVVLLTKSENKSHDKGQNCSDYLLIAYLTRPKCADNQAAPANPSRHRFAAGYWAKADINHTYY